MSDYSDRHPAVQNLMRWLTPNMNLPATQYAVAQTVWQVAETMILSTIPDSPELTEGLRKLLEAKDCLVRASMS